MLIFLIQCLLNLFYILEYIYLQIITRMYILLHHIAVLLGFIINDDGDQILAFRNLALQSFSNFARPSPQLWKRTNAPV